jgi:predicted metal-dependent phosphoesterase TrpH
MKLEATIRADLHNHTHFSPDSIMSPQDLLRRAKEAGIDCVAVTDHNTVRGGLSARELATNVIVIVGEEVRSSDGELLGLFLSQDIPAGLPAEETIARIKDQGGIVGVPHPFDPFRSGLSQVEMSRLASKIDFVEALNSRVMLGVHNKRAMEFARQHDLPVSAASDAHSPRELGRSYVEMAPFTDPSEFLQSLRSGVLVGSLSNPFIHLISRYATMRHKIRGVGK